MEASKVEILEEIVNPSEKVSVKESRSEVESGKASAVEAPAPPANPGKETVEPPTLEAETPLPDLKDLLESYDIVKTPRSFQLTQPIFTFLGRKYYLVPFQRIQEGIRVLDKSMREVPYDLRLLSRSPYKEEIEMFFNENNMGTLGDPDVSKLLHLICPKYEHFIYFNKAPNRIFITVPLDVEPTFVSSTEINISKEIILKQNMKVLRSSLLLP